MRHLCLLKQGGDLNQIHLGECLQNESKRFRLLMLRILAQRKDDKLKKQSKTLLDAATKLHNKKPH